MSVANITMQELTSMDASVVQVTVYVNGYAYTGTGTAKRHPNDHSDPQVGRALATARAMAHLGRQLQAVGDMLVHQNCQRHGQIALFETTSNSRIHWDDATTTTTGTP